MNTGMAFGLTPRFTNTTITPQPKVTPAVTPAVTPTTPTYTGKAAEVAKFSAAPGSVINTNIIDTILSNNIDKGDPNIVTGDKLKTAESKGQIDPSLGNLLSTNASVAKGAAALGVIKTETINQLGGQKSTSYSGDLLGAAKSLGIDTAPFMKPAVGAMGSRTTALDKAALYSVINDKANQLGIYSVTERVPGTPADNAKHTTTFYQNSNGVLQPLKNADGSVATATFRAPAYTSDENFFEGLVSGVKGIATDLGPIISAMLPNFGLTAGQLLAAQSMQALASGASPEEVARVIAGSITAAQVPDFLKEFQIIKNLNPVLQSGALNAASQGVFAVITEQDIALNAMAGALGGTAAELFDDLGDPALQKAIGEYTKNKALGMSDLEAGMAAAQDYAQSVSRKNKTERTAAQEQVIEAFSQGKSQGVGTQLGEATAELGGTLATTPGRETIRLPAGSDEAGVMLPIPVEDQADRFPGADVPAADIEAATRIPSTPMPSGAISTPTLTPSISTAISGTPSKLSPTERQLIDLTGILKQPTQEPSLPTVNVVDRREEPSLPPVEVTADREEPSLPPVEVVAEREVDEATKPVTEKEETASQSFPLTSKEPDTVILDLISGGGTRRSQRIPTDTETESMATLTQALRIGDPGDALFGGKLGRRRNIWNVESLRLRDEIGG
jgi:hypothetical protein